MAHKLMWYQGSADYKVPSCEGAPTFKCPESKTVAGEYFRGYFTLTNVLNPNIDVDNLGVETWLFKALQEVKVGDYLWLALVPPKHHIMDVFAFNEATFTELSSIATMGGITLSLVTGEFKEADPDGNCNMANEQSHGTLTLPEGNDAKPQFLRKAVDITTDVETWVGVGFKVDALPAGKTLAEFIGKIAIGAHVLNYDAQTFM